jgi:phosphonate transport system substrate-binding protein
MVERTTLRRRALFAAGLGLMGCGEPPAPDRGRRDPLESLPEAGVVPDVLRIGVTPSSGKQSGDFLASLVAYLARELGIEAQAVTADTYDALGELVASARVHIGVFSPLAYVKARAGLPAVAIATASRNGSPTYLGYLVARCHGRPPSLDALAGKRVAYVDPSSTSGYLYARALLRARGHDPDAFFAAPPVFAGNHSSALEAVLGDRADVAAVADAFVDPSPLNEFSSPRGLCVVAKTSRIPLDCVVVHQSVRRELARRLRGTLLALANDAEQSRLLASSWGMSGFVEADERRYNVIAEVLAASEPPR